MNQPRLPMPMRAAPEAPGCPSSALYIALLPRRFMTTTAASAAAATLAWDVHRRGRESLHLVRADRAQPASDARIDELRAADRELDGDVNQLTRLLDS